MFNIDPYHLGVIFLLNLEIGYLLPPAGLNLFIAAFRFNRPITELYKAVIPFILIMLIALGLVTYIPSLTVVPKAHTPAAVGAAAAAAPGAGTPAPVPPVDPLANAPPAPAPAAAAPIPAMEPLDDTPPAPAAVDAAAAGAAPASDAAAAANPGQPAPAAVPRPPAAAGGGP
jgi:hypothetical protein